MSFESSRDLPDLADLFRGPERRRAFRAFWHGATLDDLRDLLAVFFLRRAPVGLCSAFGAGSASIRGPLAYPLADRTARANLASLAPELDQGERERRLKARWRGVGRTMAEFAVNDRLIGLGRVRIVGGHNLLAAAADGRGLILAAVHLGNWELLSIAGRLGFTVSSFYEPRPTRAREYISQKARARAGVRLLAPGASGLRSALRILARGGLIIIFVDEEIDGVVRSPLFGRAPHRNGNLAAAARLARKSGASVAPAFVLREEASRFSAHFEPAVRLAAEDSGLLADVLRINAAVEPIVRAHLDQWFNLHEALDEPAPEKALR
jgi:KDO2-lipid IV(A) lauroyltransferase